MQDSEVLAAVKRAADALGDTGRILVRASGTEPKVRVMVEAPTTEICEQHVSDVVAVIEKRGFVL